VDFVVGDVVRQGFGFANPNHAAAAICAAFPFCWGWRGRWRWVGRLIGAALCVMLAMTYSRTGFVVLVIEAAMLWRGRKILFPVMIGRVERVETCRTSTRSTCSTWLNKMQGRSGLATAVVAVAIAAWWMWPRLALDGAILNRPKIWLAGLRLFAANPLGIGFGKSGEIASAFMLPDGITVRTLVNSHLTLLAEMGALVGGAWLVFIALALCVGRKLCRTWVAFAGLAVSAFSASVFDWHVLFDFKEMGGYGVVNFALAWGMFVAFVGMGVAMCFLTQRHKDTEKSVSGVYGFVGSIAGVAVGLCAVVWGFRSDVTPRVDGDFARVGRVGAAVYRGEGWEIKPVREFFPNGARYCLSAGVPEWAADAGEVWLFGDAAEAAWRFKGARLKLVDPPEFCEVPTNAVVLHVSTRSTRLLINAEAQSR